MDHTRAPVAIEVDGSHALASSVPGIENTMYVMKKQESAIEYFVSDPFSTSACSPCNLAFPILP